MEIIENIEPVENTEPIEYIDDNGTTFIEINLEDYEKNIKYHNFRKKVWYRIFIVLSIINTLLPFISICITQINTNNDFILYYNFVNNIINITISLYIILVNPSSISTMHSTVVTKYYKLCQELILQKRMGKNKKSLKELSEMIKSAFSEIADIKPPPILHIFS